METVDLYMKVNNPHSRLIYITGFIWNILSSELDKTLSKTGLNLSKFNILMIIRFVGGEEGIQQNEISKKLLVTPSNITKLLDKLETEDFITRNNKAGDKRVKIIKVTQKSITLIDNIWQEYNQKVNSLCPDIKEYELLSLIDKLASWQKELSKKK